MTVYCMLQSGIGHPAAGMLGVSVVFGFFDANGNFVNSLPGGSANFNVQLPGDAPRSSSALNHLLITKILDVLNPAFGLSLTDADIVIFGGAI